MKDSEIILCSGIKLDKGYENVLSYSENAMVTLCRNNAIASSYKYSILDPTVNVIQVALPYADCIYANYIAFKNPHYGNKWYFGFVNKVKFENKDTTTIEYQVDVFSTWYSRMNLGKAFVEREHVSDDTIGLHTIEEGLDTGEYVINNQGLLDEYGSDCHVVIGITKLPDNDLALQAIQKEGVSNTYTAPDTTYNGVFNGLFYFVFEYNKDASNFIYYMDTQGLADNVVTVFLVPLSIYETLSWQTKTITQTIGSITFDFSFSYNQLPTSLEESVMASGKEITLNTSLDGYVPKNNKMFTKEFNYVYMTNNNGGDKIYAYEDFTDNTPSFRVIGAVCPGCSVRLTPENYKKGDTASSTRENSLLSFGLIGGKYPTCSWRADSYTNWQTQQSVNYTMDKLGTIGSIALLGAMGNPAAIVGGMGLVFDAIKENKERELAPVQAKGNINAGDVTYACGYTNFEYFQMSCKYEYAKVCDDFLSRYGYKVNEIKTPNLNSRSQFNYIKIGGKDELVYGRIPASDLEEINNIFRKGVTIFHNYSNFGDYTVTNTINQ